MHAIVAARFGKMGVQFRDQGRAGATGTLQQPDLAKDRRVAERQHDDLDLAIPHSNSGHD